MTTRFTFRVRVYIEDTDLGGIVYYANYLKFMERARTEWLRTLGFEQESLRHQDQLFIVRDLALQYRQPARLDDELLISVQLQQLGKARMLLEQSVQRSSDNVELVSGVVTIASVTAAGKPVAMPTDIHQVISAYQQNVQFEEAE